VLPDVQVVAAYWGNFDQNEASALDNYYSQILDHSSYLYWLSEYSTINQPILGGHFVGSYWDTSVASGITGDQIQQHLGDLKATGSLPTPPAGPYGASALYLIHFPAGFYVNNNSANCAYHGATVTTNTHGSTYAYGVIKDCGGTVNAMYNASHEIIEAV